MRSGGLIEPHSGHRLAREPADVPDSHRGFEIVDHRQEIDAPYSKRCVAREIELDDIESWALAAWLRKLAQGSS